MKKDSKPNSKRAAKRDLFSELIEGMVALAEVRQGTITCPTHDRSGVQRN
jgi:hypothetical protein